MQTWRTVLSLFFFLFALNWQVSALPNPKANVGVVAPLEARSPSPLPELGALDVRANQNVYDILIAVAAKIKVEVDAVKSDKAISADKLQKHAKTIQGHISQVHAALQAHVEAKVDIGIIFGGRNSQEVGQATYAIILLIVDLATSVQASLGVDVVATVLGGLLTDVSVYVNLAVSVLVDLGDILVQLGIGVFVDLGIICKGSCITGSPLDWCGGKICSYESLKEFAVSDPSYDNLEKLATILCREYVCDVGDSVQNMKLLLQAWDLTFENMLQWQQLFLLYEEISWAMNTGDIGWVEWSFIPWMWIFWATGKHQYAHFLYQYLQDMHFTYKTLPGCAPHFHILINPMGKKGKYRGVDWVVE
ncbi:hypothetical protein Moror_5701 [Moniliophthora roreri MCA 2997]|uniref:DUF6589 domain-containing protein n=1 Tax=Moniliophthora roreri (strain MCA 2997) TaxID=1381753 RepID=V2WR75_MONRO|nr:hypothetical protein Moror_5701 [Moniliophthora roreri MCA 2997]